MTHRGRQATTRRSSPKGRGARKQVDCPICRRNGERDAAKLRRATKVIVDNDDDDDDDAASCRETHASGSSREENRQPASGSTHKPTDLDVREAKPTASGDRR